MAKKVGYEVTARRPVCVDFRDGRVVSFRPGQRFEADRSNLTVARLLRNKDLRQLSPFEKVPALPVKLGAPRKVQNVLKARARVEAAKKAAQAKFEASKKAPPTIEVVDLSRVKKPLSSSDSMPKPEADK